jgi:putative peptidoglycan lipid II flippase
LALVALGVVSFLGIVFAPQLARALTAGVDDPSIATQQQELATYLLRFFVPQILLYALGAVTTAVLHARRSFLLPAIAPIGNTIVLVAALGIFHVLAGPDPGLDLTSTEQLCLALGGTLGVAAFVGVPAIGLRSSGFRLRMGARRAVRDREVHRALRLSGWAALQHAGAGILLGAALVVAGAVEGGVVAYQFAMVVFLAPYGVVAQPIHTAVLPRLSDDAARGDQAGLRQTLHWATDSMVVSTAPLAAGLVALALPIMRVLAFGAANDRGSVELLAGALAGLALGVTVYGTFLLFSRAAYAVGDTRTPAAAALGSAALGALAMVATGRWFDGAGRLVAIGAAHSVAYLLGTAWMLWRLRPVIGNVLRWTHLEAVALATVVGVLGWGVMDAWHPDGRITTLVALGVIGAAGGAVYLAGVRLLHLEPGPAPALHSTAEPLP